MDMCLSILEKLRYMGPWTNRWKQVAYTLGVNGLDFSGRKLLDLVVHSSHAWRLSLLRSKHGVLGESSVC